ncbi:RloB family protein [Cognaticolwellia beringensis]|nr:RloB family protein [Cognaticolwellia beringensis]
MGFKDRAFGEPIYDVGVENPKIVIIISCEGRNTEPEYFNTIKKKLNEHIPALIEIGVVPKDDNKSAPQQVMDNLESFIKDKYDYKSDYDKLWIVCDTESDDEARKKQIKEIMPICDSKGYFLAICNPLFEFWLLLHIVDISTYDQGVLYRNKWETSSKKRRYIDKELSNQLINGYSKKAGKFNTNIVSLENIRKALEQERLFTNNKDSIINNLGSNLGDLIRDIIPNI